MMENLLFYSILIWYAIPWNHDYSFLKYWFGNWGKGPERVCYTNQVMRTVIFKPSLTQNRYKDQGGILWKA